VGGADSGGWDRRGGAHTILRGCSTLAHATIRCPSATAVSACGDPDCSRSRGDWHACGHAHVFPVRQLMSSRRSAALPELVGLFPSITRSLSFYTKLPLGSFCPAVPCVNRPDQDIRTVMLNPDEGIAQPRFHCGIPRCSPCFAMMLQTLAVKSAVSSVGSKRALGRVYACIR
jgi:hypothetical protein